jgi:hypothetical protein
MPEPSPPAHRSNRLNQDLHDLRINMIAIASAKSHCQLSIANRLNYQLIIIN